MVSTFVGSLYCLTIFHSAGLWMLSNALRKSWNSRLKGVDPLSLFPVSVSRWRSGRCMIFHAWTRLTVVGVTDLRHLACGSAALWQTPCLALTLMLFHTSCWIQLSPLSLEVGWWIDDAIFPISWDLFLMPQHVAYICKLWDRRVCILLQFQLYVIHASCLPILQLLDCHSYLILRKSIDVDWQFHIGISSSEASVSKVKKND